MCHVSGSLKESSFRWKKNDQMPLSAMKYSTRNVALKKSDNENIRKELTERH